MSVVFFGQRTYGRVMSHGGEHAETVFFHLQFLPLIPIRSRWITMDDGAGMRHGFDTSLNLRSVASGYLRWWAPLLAIIATGSLTTVGNVAAGIFVVLWAASWTSYGHRGELAKRRSDMDRLAFGHRCEPAILDDVERGRLSQRLSAVLARHDNPRPPDDVARFGARSFEEAIAAYGTLRLSRHAGARAAADQLLAHAYDAVPAEGGPFRTSSPASGDEVQAAIAEAIRSQVAADAQRRQQMDERRPTRWYQWAPVQFVGLGLMSLIALGFTVALIDTRARHHVMQNPVRNVACCVILNLLILAAWTLWTRRVWRYWAKRRATARR